MSTMPKSDEIDQWVEDMKHRLGIADPAHSYGDTPLTHMLNTARRNGTPHVPKHCACADCLKGIELPAGADHV